LEEQLLQESRGGPGHDDGGFVSFQFHAFDDTPHVVPFTEKVGWDLFFLWKNDLIPFIVQQNYGLMSNVVYLCSINLPFKVLELFVDGGIVMLVDLGDQVLTQGQYGPSSQIDK